MSRTIRIVTRSKKWLVTGSALAVLLATGSGSFAHFSSTGTGSGSASAGTLNAPTITAATPGAGAVALTWSTVTPPAGGSVTYYVNRDGGDPAGDCPTVASPAGVTSCTDAGLAAGTYHYAVTAVWRSWTATSSTSTVTVGSGAATHLLLQAVSSTPTAGVADNLTITAQDAANVTVTGYAGDKSLTFGGAANAADGTHPTVSDKTGVATSFGAVTAITFTAGVASVSGASNGVMRLYKAEAASITVSDGSIGNGAGLSVTVSPGAAASLVLAAASLTPTAGVADNLTVTAKDGFSNTATGYVGDKSLTFSGASTVGGNVPTVSNKTGVATSFGAATTITFAAGVASVSGANNGVMRLYKKEAASIVVSDGSIGNGAGLSVTVSSTGTATSLLLAAASSTPTAGAADNLTVTARDTYTNTEVGYTGAKSLTFSGASVIGGNNPTVSNSSGTAINFGAVTAITFTAGVASVSGASNGVMRLYKAEAASITVTDGSIGNGAGLSVTVSPGAAASLVLAAASSTPTAGVADNLTVTAKDGFSNTATGYVGDKSLTFSGASTVGGNVPTVSNKTGVATSFGAATTITFAAGVASVSGASNGVMRLYKKETASIVVSDGSIGNGAGLSVTVSSTGTATSLLLAAASSTPTAGAADNLTVTARDTYTNTEVGYTGAKSLTFSGASVIGGNNPTVSNSSGTAINFGAVTAITFTAGVASVSGASNGVMRLYKAETASIIVTDGSIGNGAGLSVTVSPGAAASLVLAAASSTPTAGVADNLTVTAKDGFSNTATGYVGDKSLTFSGASTVGGNVPTVSNKTGVATSFGAATTITFAAGVASVSGGNNGVMRLYKKEAASIVVSDGSIGNGAGLSVTVSSTGTATSLLLAAASSTPTAGAADNLTVTARDTYTNTEVGYTGAKSLTFSGASVIGGNNPTVSNSSGTAINFGAVTAITFTAGVASVSGASNGVMRLYKTEAASIVVSDGSIGNGAGLSVTVSSTGAAASLLLAAASSTPTAGAADNLTVTARDTYTNTEVGYTGAKSLTFSGASVIGGNNPTVSNSSGTAINFGAVTAITFTAGVASVSGSNNGVMRLYKAESASIVVSDGSIGNGAGLTVTVAAGAATKLAFITAPQTITAGGAASGTITVEREDAAGNATTLGGAITVNLSSTSGGGSFRNSGNTATITSVTIAGGGSSADFKYKDTTIGTPTITAASAGLTSATQGVTVNAAGTMTALRDGAWDVTSTWQGTAKTGTVTCLTISAAVTGSGTLFTTQLAVGDAIYRTSNSALIGTVQSITDNTHLTLTANAATNQVNRAYSANGNIPDASDNVTVNGFTVTIPSSYDALANSVTIGTQASTLQFAAATSTLTVTNDVTLAPSGGSNDADLTVNAGTLTVGGNLALTGSGGGRNSTLTITTGSVSVAGNLSFASPSTLAMSGGAGTFNLAGSMTGSGTLTAGATSTFNFNGTAAQTVPVSSFNFNNLSLSNTSASGATLGAAVTTSNVAGNLSVASGTFDNGGFAIAGNASKTFQVAAGATFKLSGTTSAFPTGFGTVSLNSTSTVDYAGSGNQTLVSAPTYGNLSTSVGGTKTAGGALTTNGGLSIGSGSTFAASTFSHVVKGDFTNNGTFTTGAGSTVTFSGSSPQTVGGTTATTFVNLTIGNAVSLGGVDATATGTLALGSSVLATGSNTMVVTTTAPTRTTGYVDGALQRTGAVGTLTFAVGNGSNYTPVDVTLVATSTGTLTVRSTAGENPNGGSGIDQSHDVNTYWTLGATGTITFGTPSATFNYPAGNVDAGSTPASFIVKRWNGSTWSSVTVSGTPTSTATSVTGLTSGNLGGFVIGN